MAMSCAKELNHDKFQGKTTISAYDECEFDFDVAVDDDHAAERYLSAKKFIFVNEVPDNEADFSDFLASFSQP